MKSASILYIDGDDFFASVARLKDPTLRKRPLIIGDLDSRGAVVSTSREIRKSGIKPGFSMMQAKRICPDAELVQIDRPFVQKVSQRFFTLISNYSPLVELAEVDAVFLDYSGCERLFGSAENLATRLQKQIHGQIGFSVSIGLSSDKAVSAVACRAAKTGLLETVPLGAEKTFLCHCPLEWLPGVNSRLVSYFSDMGIKTIGEMSKVSSQLLEHLLGTEGRVLYLRAQGSERSYVHPTSSKKHPFSHIQFAKDMISPDAVLQYLARLASELCEKLRRHNMSAQQLITQIIYTDRKVEQIQAPIQPPSNRDHEVFQLARQSFLKLYRRRVRIRDVVLSAKHLSYPAPELPFGEAQKRLKWDQALHCVDKARKKYGSTAISLGASLPFYSTTPSLTNKNTPHLSQLTSSELL
ncbi:MAG: hypothetical protein WBM02_03485 [bacterium]